MYCRSHCSPLSLYLLCTLLLETIHPQTQTSGMPSEGGSVHMDQTWVNIITVPCSSLEWSWFFFFFFYLSTHWWLWSPPYCFSVRALGSHPFLTFNCFPLEYYWVISWPNLSWFTKSPSRCLALPPPLVPVTTTVTLCLPLSYLCSALSVIPCSFGIFTRGRRDCAVEL